MKNLTMKFRTCSMIIGLLAVVVSAAAQTATTNSPATLAATQVPPLVQFSSVATNQNGKPLSGLLGITFYLYQEQEGGAPLWLETQNVQADQTGHYTVMLGATASQGLPASLFASGQARWLGVQVQGQEEQPRVLLLSVPYALKAGDAQTVGGLPPTAFVLAAPPSGANAATAMTASSGPGSASPAASDVTGSGTANYVPLWTSTSNIGNSVVYQSGTGSTAKVGINTTTPASTLDVKGASTVRGLFSLPSAGTANASKGYNSQPIEMSASAFNTTAGTAIAQNFQWQAEPVNNDKSNASGTLNLLFATGSNKLAETGLNIASNGQITFAKGQAFPNTGTVTSVGSGLGLKGGPITNSGTLTIDTTVVPQLNVANTFTGNQTVKGSVTATSFSGSGSGITGVDASELGGLASSAFAQLAAANTFTANQTVNATLTAATVNGTNANLNTLSLNSTAGNPVYVTGAGPAADTVVATTFSSTGSTIGVDGETYSSDPASYGVYGAANSTSGEPVGVYGAASSPFGIGTFGQNGSESNNGQVNQGVVGAGVWGDGGTSGDAVGVLGTVDDGYAGVFVNSSTNGYTVEAINGNSQGDPLLAYNAATGAYCVVDNNGDLGCSGSKNAIVPIDGGKRKVALSAIESPVNWFEDAGSAQLVNGSAVVALDADYMQTVNTEMEYNVFLTPYGDCKGLYVTNRTANSFEVRELGGGSASLSFGYRIMALRKKYESVRFADHTNDPDPNKMMARMKRAQPQSHNRTKAPMPPPKRSALLTTPGTVAR